MPEKTIILWKIY